MDILIEGKKGSGKTYYAVDYVSKLDPEAKDKVLHNIDGFNVGMTFDQYCKQNGIDFYTLFTEEYHNQHTELHGYLFIIDEVQKLFPKSHKNESNFHFFQMSRHFNIDNILITQDSKNVSYAVACHAELVLKAIPDLANPYPGMFLYHEMSGYEKVGTIKIRKKKEVFELYKSANYDTGGKERNKKRPMRNLAIIAIIATVAVIFFGYRFVNSFSNNDDNAVEPLPTTTPITPITHSRPLNQNYGPNEIYPPSLLNLYGGVLTPISTFSDDDHNTYALLLGISYKLNDFPYKIYTTGEGFFAIVPIDVYQSILTAPDPELRATRERGAGAGEFVGAR